MKKSLIQKLLCFAAFSGLFATGCSQDFAFQEVLHSCTPPKSSARYGKNIGPVIMSPAEGTPARGTMIVSGTCADGFPLTIEGRGVNGAINAACASGAFSVEVTFDDGDGTKEVDVHQPTFKGEPILDRRCFEKDTVPPRVIISGSSGAQSVNVTTVMLEGVCENGLDVEITGPQLVNSVTTQCTRGHFRTPVTFTGTDGLKDVIATQVDPAGNNGQDDAQYTTDTTPPVVTISSPAANSVSRGLFTITGTCEIGPRVLIQGGATPATFDCIGGTYSGDITLTSGDGVKNVEASQADVAGNTGRANRDFIKDATPPVVRITSPAANSVTRNSVTVGGTCETGLQVRLNGADVQAAVTTNCVAGAFSAAVTLTAPDGVKTVDASQTDLAGNIGLNSRSFVRDADAPVITITNPAAGSAWPTGVSLQGACETGLTVNISGTGAQAPANTSCVNGAYTVLVPFSNGDGAKTLTASQTDLAGNTGSASRNFVRDSSAPNIRITSPADGAYVQASATIVGTCESGTPVVLSGTGLSSSVNTACNSGAFSQLVNFTASEGNKQVIATQTDAGGNSSSDTKNYIKDTTAPNIRITQPAANTVDQTGVTLMGTCETGLTVNISGAGVSAASTTNCVGGAFSSDILFSNGDGAKTVMVSQTDAAGNSASDSRSFVRDSTAPVISITSPAANTAAQNGLTISGACENGLNVLINGAGVQTAVNVMCAANAYSAAIVFTAGDGVKNVVASQTDSSSNTSSANRNFVKDNTDPVITITNPAANSYVSSNATIQGTCETGLLVSLSGAGLSAGVSTNCVGGNFSAAVSFSAGDGSKNVIASQTDGAGNMGSTNRSFLRDSTDPAILITNPAANTVDQTGLTISGTCETGLTVNISGAGVNAASTTNCVGSSFSAAILFSNGDGAKTVTVSQTDAAGNTGTDSRVFQRDSTAPGISITSPAANTAAQTGLTVSGSCEIGIPVVLNGTGVQGSVNTVCAAGSYSAAINFTAGEGIKNVVASQTDSVGNTATANRNFIRDNTDPMIAITSPAANSFVGASATIQGTCETGLMVMMSGTGLSASASGACAAGNFSILVNFTAGDGIKNVVAEQTDSAGNVGTTNRNYNVDSTDPAIAITSPAVNTVGQNGLTISGTCETGLTVNISGAGVNAASTTNCIGSAFTAAILFSNGDGAKVVTVSQTDAAGNVGSDSRTFQRDTTDPVITISNPAANTPAQTGLTVSGSCETGLNVVLNGAGVQGTVNVMCAASAYSAAITFTAGEGVKNVVATQTDAVGNSASANRNFVRDNTGPAINITAPAANALVGLTATITGTCEAGGSTVTLSGAGVQGSVNANCVAGNFSGVVTFTAGDGNKLVQAAQNDVAGNTGTDTVTVIRDGTAPVLTFTSPAANSVHGGSFTITGTCETGLVVTLSGAGLTGPASTACTLGTFSEIITVTNGDGNKVITVSQTDASANTGSASRTFVRDSTAPAIVITQPAANTVARNGVTIQGTCEAGLIVNLSGAGISAATTTACAAGTFSQAINFSNGDGNKVIVASQTDAVGNVGTDSRTFIRDTTAPNVQITSPAANTASATGVTVGGTCETGLNVALTGALSAAVNTPCVAGAFSAAVLFSAGNGAKLVTATQTDGAGNTGSDSRSFMRANNAGYDSFTSNGPGGMVDILFVDDNSASMDAEQAALGSKFSAFTSALSGLDWQVGITTTDCTAGSPYNICGSLLQLAGMGAQTILTALTPNYLTVFQNTIQRPETLNCLITGTCPSGREEGLKATINAMNKRSTNNAGFFRNGADLAVVYLTDEDEQSNAPATATQPSAVVNNFTSIWGTSKKFITYGIIIKPGDAACLATQRSQPGGNAFYATLPAALSTQTGGMNVSICEPDYSVTLTQIGEDVTRLSKTMILTNTPIAGTVSVTFTPAWTTTWSVSGNRITFDNPAPLGTLVEIFYEY